MKFRAIQGVVQLPKMAHHHRPLVKLKQGGGGKSFEMQVTKCKSLLSRIIYSYRVYHMFLGTKKGSTLFGSGHGAPRRPGTTTHLVVPQPRAQRAWAACSTFILLYTPQ